MRHRYRLLVTGLGLVALTLALVLVAPWGQDPVAANGTIHYVDADAMGANNGSSWADAFTELQPALDAALSGDQIWVAAGTYKPTAEHGGSGDRYKSFQMVNGVAIYGGFDPTVDDDTWEERDWVDNPTILSGDLHGDDGPDFENNDENSYHVFYHPGGTDLDASAILDGFTISGGNANGGTSPHNYGGGMYNVSSSPTLTNCAFSGNGSGWWGGGMYNNSSSPTLTNCTFSDNSATGSGGGMHNTDSSSPVLTGCTFTGNSAGDNYGGGMYNGYYSSPALTHCTFSGNSAGGGGGMINAVSSSPGLTNCTFAGNSARYGGGMYNHLSAPTLTNCTFSGNSAYEGGGVYNVSDSSPTLTNCTFSGNWAKDWGGGIVNKYGSSATLTNCILWGDTPEEIYNSESTPVVTYSDIHGGYPGEGNIDSYPFFVDPANGDFHLGACSPCIDAGDNDAPDLPPYDFEGDDRILDGNGDGEPVVDMGVDEVAVVGTCLRVYLPVVLRGY